MVGSCIYFWENNVERAEQWAEDNSKIKNSSIKTPGVLGAYLDLGNCLDLTDSGSLQLLKIPYDTLKKSVDLAGMDMPVNKDPLKVKSRDRILRKLDCAVIQHYMNLPKKRDYLHMTLFGVSFGKEMSYIQGQALGKRIIFR